MKRYAAILAMALIMGACEAPKPWSPYDEEGSQTGRTSSEPLPTAAPTIDIGDAEQGVYVEAKIAPESLNATVKAEEIQDYRKYATKLTIETPPPAPAEFWIDYSLRCSRDFKERPVVLRAEIKVEGQPIDTIVAVLGANARKNTYTKKVNVLKNFATPPATLLATVTGTLLLAPEGMAEGSINPETMESSATSQALQFTLVRLNAGSADSPEQGEPAAPPSVEAGAPAEPEAPGAGAVQ